MVVRALRYGTLPEPSLRSWLPGDTVRFAATDEAIDDATSEIAAIMPRYPAFEVIDPGGMATIQDLGRAGLAHLGVGTGGAFDVAAARRANSLVGNEADAAVLEMTWTGPRFVRCAALRLRLMALISAALLGA